MIEIKTERLLLRPYEKDDAARIAEIANNKNIAENMVETFPFPYTLEDAEGWTKIASGEEKNKTNFAIVLDGEVIGGAGFDLKSGLYEGVASGGYWLGEDYWGKGFATEVWMDLVNYAFENFDIRRMEAGVFGWNNGSMKVQDKCGFKKESVLRNSILRMGRVGDEVRYGLLREEWEAMKDGKS